MTTDFNGAYSDGAFCEAGTPKFGRSKTTRGPATLVCPSSAPNLLASSALTRLTPTQPPTTTSAVGLGSVDVGNLFAAWATAGLSSTTTTLQSSENPSKYGDSVTFTATVTDNRQRHTDWHGDLLRWHQPRLAPARWSSAASAMAEMAYPCPPPRPSPPQHSVGRPPHSITAVYGGDSNNASSTSSLSEQVVNRSNFHGVNYR